MKMKVIVISITVLILITIVVFVILRNQRPQPIPDQTETTSTEVHERVYAMSMPIDTSIEENSIIDIASSILVKYTNENNLPPATYVDKVWNEDDGLHAYIQSTFGDQVYEVCITDTEVKLDFYGTAYHRGCKGIAYGNATMKDVDVAALEETLISMGYSNLLFTVKEVKPESVVLESETGFTQEIKR